MGTIGRDYIQSLRDEVCLYLSILEYSGFLPDILWDKVFYDFVHCR